MWIFKRLGSMYATQGYAGEFNIYCNIEVANSINNMYSLVLPSVFANAIRYHITVHILKDNEVVNLAGYNIKFFDLHLKGNMLFGFETILHNDKRLIFLGDETCNPELYDKIKDSDYVMHEAFCLDAEEPIFKAYEKHHSTVKSVCQEMNKLNIKNLILYHTEDNHKENKKELYTNEAKQYFKNNVIVPDDLEIIELN